MLFKCATWSAVSGSSNWSQNILNSLSSLTNNRAFDAIKTAEYSNEVLGNPFAISCNFSKYKSFTSEIPLTKRYALGTPKGGAGGVRPYSKVIPSKLAAAATTAASPNGVGSTAARIAPMPKKQQITGCSAHSAPTSLSPSPATQAIYRAWHLAWQYA